MENHIQKFPFLSLFGIFGAAINVIYNKKRLIGPARKKYKSQGCYKICICKHLDLLILINFSFSNFLYIIFYICYYIFMNI